MGNETPQSVEAWRVFAESVEDFAFILMDTGSRITGWNTGAQKLLGYAPQQVIGQSGEIIFVPEDRKARVPEQERARASAEGRAEDERWHLRSDGSRFRASGILTVLRDREERPVGFAKILRDLTAREQEREQMERTLNERNALIREIQHRVKNNLQMIVSLISLQSNRTTEPGTLGVLQELHSRVRTIAAVHETLYATPSFATIGMYPLLQQLVRNLRGLYNGQTRIQINLNAAGLSLDLREALPVALVANELISNTLKHAFPEDRHGHVDVNLSYDQAVANGEAALTVSDNGVGLPESMNFESSRSLGFELVRILVDQLHGRIQVESNTSGTRFELCFPVGGG